MMRARSSVLVYGPPLRTLLTLLTETPAAVATSRIVARAAFLPLAVEYDLDISGTELGG